MKSIGQHQPPRTNEQNRHLSPSIGEKRFAEEYLLDLDPRGAAERSGFPAQYGSKLLSTRRVQQAITVERSRRASRTNIYADEVLRRWWLLATADVRELVQLRRAACRHCYGIDNQYQFTKNELRRAIQRHQQAQLSANIPQSNWVEFDDLGGDGYDATKSPSEDCTECFGEGIPTVWLEDSRNYSAAAAILFDGVKVSKDGAVELKLRDRSAALELVAKHLGMLVTRQAIMTIDPTQLSDDQLDTVLNQFARLEGRLPLIEHEDETSEIVDNVDEFSNDDVVNNAE